MLAPSAFGFSYSASTDGIGCSAIFSVPTEESLVASTALDGTSLSNTITGRGDLHENHFVGNRAGATALVRADVTNASSYTYSYELVPSPVAALNAAEVQASESLDVQRADYIRALALASAPGLYSSASTEVRGGSLSGYTNMALASADMAKAYQNLDAASVSVRTYSRSEYVRDGTLNSSYVTTSVQGDLTEYYLAASSRAAGSEITENSHIVGSFVSDAAAGNQFKRRTSDFGNEFDLTRYAKLGKGSGGLKGVTKDSQGYHVSPGDKIQDAIDAASNGDSINVLPGTYYENLEISKSLYIYGAGSGNTIIDGSKKGSVIAIIPTINPAASAYDGPRFYCNLYDLAIKDGSSPYGSGIFVRYSDLDTSDISVNLNGCEISGNSAKAYGGGIYNIKGTVTLNDCEIYANSALIKGGGIYNNGGKLDGDLSSVHDNSPDNIY